MNLKFEHSQVLAPAEATSILQQVLDYVAYLGSIEISNDGANATTAFSLQVQDHPHGEFYTVLSGSDFGTPNIFLQYSSTNSPASLTSNSKAHLRLNLNGIYAMRLIATSTSGTTISVRGGSSVISRN